MLAAPTTVLAPGDCWIGDACYETSVNAGTLVSFLKQTQFIKKDRKKSVTRATNMSYFGRPRLGRGGSRLGRIRVKVLDVCRK